MKYEKQFREAHPETIGEAEQDFDRLNYIDWIDEEYTKLKNLDEATKEAESPQNLLGEVNLASIQYNIVK